MLEALILKARQFTLWWRSGLRPENQRLLPGTSIQMVEDLLDDHRVFNTGSDVHAPTTVPAGLKIGSEGSLHRKQTLKKLCSNGRSGSVLDVRG